MSQFRDSFQAVDRSANKEHRSVLRSRLRIQRQRFVQLFSSWSCGGTLKGTVCIVLTWVSERGLGNAPPDRVRGSPHMCCRSLKTWMPDSTFRDGTLVLSSRQGGEAGDGRSRAGGSPAAPRWKQTKKTRAMRQKRIKTLCNIRKLDFEEVICHGSTSRAGNVERVAILVQVRGTPRKLNFMRRK